MPKALISPKVPSEGLPSLVQHAAVSCMGQEDKQQTVTKATSRTAMSARQKNNTFVQYVTPLQQTLHIELRVEDKIS
jgi:hypothetical protein